MKAIVTTTIVQEIEVPEGASQQDVLNFLAEHESFRDALVGISDPEQRFRITDIEVLIENVDQLGEECFE